MTKREAVIMAALVTALIVGAKWQSEKSEQANATGAQSDERD